MARGGGGGFPVLEVLVGVAISLLVLAVVFMIIPVIGGSFDTNMPALSATSEWNATYNTKLTSGADFWTGLSPFIYLAALVAIAFLIIYIIRGRS